MVTATIGRLKTHSGSLLFLLMAILAVYGRIVGHEFLMTWDDRLYVVHNEAVQGFSWQHLRTIFSSYYVGNYAPVQMLSYMADHALWGMNAGGFLLTNIIIHAMNGLLVYRLLLICHDKPLVAVTGAAFFLLHPVQVESVAWISQRKNLLAMFFFLIAFEGYRSYLTAARGSGRGMYVASVTAFFLALLAKSVAVIFPLVIMLYDYCYNQKGRRILLPDKIPYILAAVAFAFLTVHSQQPADDGWGGGVGGGASGYHGGSVYATFLTMLTVICRYLGMLVWPDKLSAAYDPVIHHSINSYVIGASLLLTGICVLTLRFFKADRKGAFWIPVFFIGLLPVSQIVPLITLMNDRYLYFPMLGAAALFGYTTAIVREKLPPRYVMPGGFLLVLLFVLLAATSFQRAAVWRNDISIGRDTATKCPARYSVWEGLGEAYYFAVPQRQDDAVHAFTRALELDPQSKLTLYNLGVLYLEMGNYDRSQALLQRLVASYRDHVAGWACLGDVYFQTKNYLEAEKCYKWALTLKPDTEQARAGLTAISSVREKTAPDVGARR